MNGADPSLAGVRASAVALHIGRLELHGFPEARRYAIADACQRELTRLLEHDPQIRLQAQQGRVIEPLAVRLDPSAAPELVGAAIARAIHDGLCKPRPWPSSGSAAAHITSRP